MGKSLVPKQTSLRKCDPLSRIIETGLLALAVPAIFLLGVETRSLRAAQVVVSFSTAPPNAFLDPAYYHSAGLTLGDSHYVTSTLQGSPALVVSQNAMTTLPITGDFSTGVTALSVEIAPFFQGAAVYHLVAFDVDSLPILDHSIRIVQDENDPLSGPFGYVKLGLGPLKRLATSFQLTSSFERGYGQLTAIDYGIRTISFTPVPEPMSASIALAAVAMLILHPRNSLK